MLVKLLIKYDGLISLYECRLFIYLFICDLFNAPVSSSVYIQRPVVGDKEIINWKGCERKRSWPNLRYRLGISWRG